MCNNHSLLVKLAANGAGSTDAAYMGSNEGKLVHTTDMLDGFCKATKSN